MVIDTVNNLAKKVNEMVKKIMAVDDNIDVLNSIKKGLELLEKEYKIIGFVRI